MNTLAAALLFVTFTADSGERVTCELERPFQFRFAGSIATIGDCRICRADRPFIYRPGTRQIIMGTCIDGIFRDGFEPAGMDPGEVER